MKLRCAVPYASVAVARGRRYHPAVGLVLPQLSLLSWPGVSLVAKINVHLHGEPALGPDAQTPRHPDSDPRWRSPDGFGPRGDGGVPRAYDAMHPDARAIIHSIRHRLYKNASCVARAPPAPSNRSSRVLGRPGHTNPEQRRRLAQQLAMGPSSAMIAPVKDRWQLEWFFVRDRRCRRADHPLW